MRTIKIVEDIFLLTANDRRTNLFENFWPLENGVSYNSYLIVDEKIAVIDTVEKSFVEDFLEQIQNKIGNRNVDYLIINHMEPDHSAGIKSLIKKYPNIHIFGNKMTFSLIRAFVGIHDGQVLVCDNHQISLGKNVLEFIQTPWIHWPETMMTYNTENKILFSGDAFGSFGTLDGGVFDDEVNLEFYVDEMLRYYSNIVGNGKYSKMVLKTMDKLKAIEISHVASTHGPIWRTEILKLLNYYQNWSSYQSEKGVLIIFASMYGNTEKLADAIARELAIQGIKNVRVYDVSKRHISYILRDLWKYRGVILGSCAYNAGLFPAMKNLTMKLEEMEVENKLLGTFGSSGWNKAGVKELNSFAERIKWQLVSESAETKGIPDFISLEQCKIMAKKMAKRLHEEYPEN
jgi:flavorubredoxin